MSVTGTIRTTARNVLPRSLRIELRRLARAPLWLWEWPRAAGRPRSPVDGSIFRHILATHRSPLERKKGALPPALQEGKERNVALGTSKLDGVVIEPGQVFSYHRLVGRPSRSRGFRTGLELHEGELSAGVGGGLCQVSNMLYLLALRSGLDVVERHRHDLDIFPDHERTIPFGCGATVYYNFKDLRFVNNLGRPVLVRLELIDGWLVGALMAPEHPGFEIEVYEVDHRFFCKRGEWHRENRIRRRFLGRRGRIIRDELIAHNLARVLYQPNID